MEQSFIPLLLVVGLAFLVPVVLARFRRIPVSEALVRTRSTIWKTAQVCCFFTTSHF